MLFRKSRLYRSNNSKFGVMVIHIEDGSNDEIITINEQNSCKDKAKIECILNIDSSLINQLHLKNI
jgi:hypothetical protein